MVEEKGVNESQEKAEEAPKGDDELVEALKELDITNPSQLQGMAQASSEAGRLANMVGELRAKVTELETRNTPQPQPEPQGYESYGNDDVVNLDSAIEKGVRKVMNDIATQSQQVQQQAVQRRNADIQRILNDRHYNLMSDAWNTYAQNPTVQQRFASGKSVYEEYNEFRVEALDRLVRQGGNAAQANRTPGSDKVPHVETTQQGNPNVLQPNPKDEQIKSLKEKWAGNDDDIMQSLDVFLPPGELSKMQ